MAQGTERSVFDTLLENLNIALKEIKDAEHQRSEPADFHLDTHWPKLEAGYKVISAETTKLCIVFSKPPAPSDKDCETLISGIEKAVLAIVSAYYGLPKSKGIALRKRTQHSVRRVIKAVHELVSVVQSSGTIGSPEHLQSTGSVWECCDQFQSLPKDNRAAVVLEIKESAGLVQDALEEIEEAQADSGDGGWDDLDELMEAEGQQEAESAQTLSAADKALLAPAIGLVKAAKACLKKTLSAVKSKGQCDCASEVSQLDELCDGQTGVSSAVDDLVTCLYPPMRRLDVTQNAEHLASVLRHLLEVVKHIHISTEDDAAWIEFLTKAVQHNLDKVKYLTDDALS